jgi:hypothetical protein
LGRGIGDGGALRKFEAMKKAKLNVQGSTSKRMLQQKQLQPRGNLYKQRNQVSPSSSVL